MALLNRRKSQAPPRLCVICFHKARSGVGRDLKTLTRIVYLVVVFTLFALASAEAQVSSKGSLVTASVLDALSLEDGTAVSLKAVSVDKVSKNSAYIVVRAPWSTAARLIVLLSVTPDLTLSQTVDVSGVLTTTDQGCRALTDAQVLVYHDSEGKIIQTPLPPALAEEQGAGNGQAPAPSPTDTAVASASSGGMSLLSEGDDPPPGPTPTPDPTEPDYIVDSIADLAEIPDGATVRLSCKPVASTGTDTTYGSYFVAGEDGSSDTLQTFSAAAAGTDMRVASVQGTLSTSGSVRVLSVDSGPAAPPMGFDPQVQLAAAVTIAFAKTLADQSQVTLENKVVSRTFPTQGYFYVQEPGRSAGIRVKNATMAAQVSPGSTVSVTGTMKSESYERYVDVSTSGSVTSGSAPQSVVVRDKYLGGSDWPVTGYDQATGKGQKGVIGNLGLTNIGLLVKVAGKVTTAGTGTGFFYLDDGSGADDTTSHGTGTRISLSWQTSGETPMSAPAAESVVTVAGISSVEHIGFDGQGKPLLVPVVRPRSQSDIVTEQAGTPGGGGGALPYNPPPVWAEELAPTDSTPADGGPSDSDFVDLASGTSQHEPGADIVVNNPIGPDVSFGRLYRSGLAEKGIASAGLSVGWRHNYDLRILEPAGWGDLQLVYPTGAVETLRPLYSGNTPTGSFAALGAPYIVSGQPSTTGGKWDSIDIRFGDGTRLRFMPPSSTNSQLLLKYIFDARGNYVVLNRNSATDERLVSVQDSASNPLLSFAYDGSQLLSSVTDVSVPTDDRTKVTFTFGASGGGTSLTHVSQIVPVSTSTPGDRWAYTYQAVNGMPYLSTVGCPDPSPANIGIRNHTIHYGPSGFVDKLIDANSFERRYTYHGDSTDVGVYNASSSLVQSWTQRISAGNADAGIIDANNKSSAIGYLNLFRPWQVVTRSGQKVEYRDMDAYGHFHTCTAYPGTSRELTTMYYYQDAQNPLHLTKVQTSGMTPTEFSYYQSNESSPGLLKTVKAPKPGSAHGSGEQVVTSYTYTTLGNIDTVTAAGPNDTGTATVTKYHYTSDPDYADTATEALGQPLAVSVYEGSVGGNLLSRVHYRYDSRGRVKTVIDGILVTLPHLPHMTDISYNDDDQIIDVLYPPLSTDPMKRVHAHYTYVYSGGPLKQIDLYDDTATLFRQTFYDIGKEGELKGQSGAIQTSTYEYDAQYRPTKVTDGRGYPTGYQYDGVGNLWKLFYASGVGTTDSSPGLVFEYDDDGNLKKRTDGKGQVTDYVLDSATDNRLTDIKYDNVLTYHYDYDAYGRVTGITDPNGVTTAGSLGYTYDDNDLAMTATTTYPSISAKTFTYGYYPDGSRKSMATPAGTYSYSYGYDSTGSGLKVSVNKWWLGSPLDCYYNVNRQIVRQNQVKVRTTYEYDARGFLKKLWNTTSSSPYPTRSMFSGMTYDAAGNRERASITIDAVDSAEEMTGTVLYSFDNKNRLSSEQRTRSGKPDLYNNFYTPDAADNFSPFAGLSFTFNSKNQTSAGIFDSNGNATSYIPATGRSFGLGYDVENQPQTVSGGRSALSLAYRADGLRAWKSVDSGPKTYYLYDGDSLVCELDSSGSVSMNYLWGPNGLGQQFDGTFYRVYAFDPQGTLVQMVRQTDLQGCAFTQVYDAYGRVWSDQSTLDGQPTTPNLLPSIGYVGQWGVYTDQETRPSGSLTPLPLMGVRYYDPITGRFLSRDPMPSGVNLYSYADGNPVKFMDPSGLKPTGTYLGDVGQVFVGYGHILNPINAVKSGVQLYRVARKNGVKAAGKAAWQGVKSGYTTWLTTSDPTAFGESFGTILTTTVAVAAPYAKAGVGAKAASAEHQSSGAGVAGGLGPAPTGRMLPAVINQGMVVGGKTLTKHASETAVAREITPSMIGATLRKGTRCYDAKTGSVTYVLSTQRRFLEVGTNAHRITHVSWADKVRSRYKRLK